ncbi:hypothetical protein C2G38_2160189 [Gigaspora rosea]|uniref:SWIM-type domain-containing protein n=1 Tax=Gigaspora rosea TaxID=44941 RepID=A0A397VYB8_9GLOM|nr:hypothetical protein C2G38_2160189 [Gigaspora rosea]
MVWRPLLPNLQCMQVPLTKVPSVLDLYTFDTISPGGSRLGDGYQILSENCTNRCRVCEGDVKTITLVDEHAKQLYESTFAYVEYLGCSARKNTVRMSSSIRKMITSRMTSITPSILATELMNNSKTLSKTLDTPANQVQPTSTRFAPNLEPIQNALKYDKKLHYPCISEFEKICSIIDDYEAEGTAIAKQYGVKDTQDPKKQAVLLAFMVRLDEPRGRVVATFVSDKEIIPVVDLMFESNNICLNPKWLAMDKWEPYLAAARKHFPNTQVVLCDWHETDALKEWFTKNLNDQWLRDRAAVGIASLVVAETIASYFQRYWFGDWHDAAELNVNEENSQYDTAELDVNKENSQHDAAELNNIESLIDKYDIKQTKTLYVTCRSGNFACPCGFYVICGHDCQDIVAVRLFIDKVKLQKSADESVASSSLESYLRQKDANGHKKDELKLPEKRGPKNKRKSHLVPGESIHLRDTILNMPYKNIKIVEIIGESRVIVDITFENGNTDRSIVQMVKPIPSSKDSYGNVVVFTIPYGGKKDTLFFTSTCPVDTSLTLMQSAFTHQNIYKQATFFALSDPNSRIHLLVQVFDLIKQKMDGG